MTGRVPLNVLALIIVIVFLAIVALAIFFPSPEPRLLDSGRDEDSSSGILWREGAAQ